MRRRGRWVALGLAASAVALAVAAAVANELVHAGPLVLTVPNGRVGDELRYLYLEPLEVAHANGQAVPSELIDAGWHLAGLGVYRAEAVVEIPIGADQTAATVLINGSFGDRIRPPAVAGPSTSGANRTCASAGESGGSLVELCSAPGPVPRADATTTARFDLGGNYPLREFWDLESRRIVRSDRARTPQPDGPWHQRYGPLLPIDAESTVRFPSKGLPGVGHQGQTLRVADDRETPPGVREALALGAVVAYREAVVGPARVNGVPSLGVRMELATPGPNPLVDRHWFNETVWFSEDVPYPILIQFDYTYLSPGAEPQRQAYQMALAQYKPGEGGPLWNQGPTAAGAGSEVVLERSAAQHPIDGAASTFPFPLGRALGAISSDGAVPGWRAWSRDHKEAYLVAAFGREDLAAPSLYRWSLVYATPQGAAYELEAIQSANGTVAVTERGAWSLPPFDPDWVPRGPITFAEAERQYARALGSDALQAPNRRLLWGTWLWTVGRSFHTEAGLCRQTEELNRDPHARVLQEWEIQLGSIEVRDCHPVERLLVVDATDARWKSLYNSDFGTVPVELVVLSSDLNRLREVSLKELAPGGLRAPQVQLVALSTMSLIVLIAFVYLGPLLKFEAGRLLLLAPGYSKLRREALLDNEARDALVEAIRQEPGIHASELGRRLEAGWGTIVYHLGVLERNGLVSSLVDGRHRRFFPVGALDWSDRALWAALRNPQARAIFDLVAAEPGIILRDVGRRVGLSSPGALWHLQRLAAVGLVEAIRQGRKVRYYARTTTQALGMPEASPVAPAG